ncbi:protein kinase domain-containing protein [Streptomyces xanthii]|uniref:Protein kinase n=1 Tax=Streptomyces xanthii TaxID=2768069 RepID=A0A7H1B5N3_9ACTN|nr:protein kinase [Streptomyces xanthii]QNS04038.1 protein kinase [Streptomyces xanthii]
MLTPLTGAVRRVGPYRLLGRIGAGGMGEVFLARRETVGGIVEGPFVAVKTVRTDFEPDGEFRTRFRREIDAARAVTGPGTAAPLDGDADAELPWLATEYVPGPALSDAVTRCGPLPVPAVRALGAGLARALDAVHAARVLHRDLKPGNVLLAADGPRLIDFGIAQAFDATALTATGLVVGTPGYLSPEQLTGAHPVTAASDLFCLGAVLCFAASGRGPFDDDEPASVLHRIAAGRADLSEVPPLLRDLIARCLRPDPAERPTAAALAAELSAAATDLAPWPADFLSLIAEQREAVARCEQVSGAVALENAATAADAPRAALVVPPSPTAAVARPAGPPTSSPAPAARRRRWPWAVAAAALVTALAVTVPVLLPDGTPEPPAAGATPTASDEGTGQDTGPLALPDADPGHSGEFTSTALDTKQRPDGWRPWARHLTGTGRTGGCTAGAGLLVCGDGTGAARALDLATGEEQWRSKGFSADRLVDDVYPETPTGNAAIAPATDGTLFFVPARSGIIGVEAATGRVRWHYAREGFTGLIGVTYADGKVYAARYNNQPEDSPDAAIELSALDADTGTGDWGVNLPEPAGPLVVHDGWLYGALARGGVRGARPGTAPDPRARDDLDCSGLLSHADSLLCWSTEHPGIAVLDPETLRTRRTLAPSVTPAAAPVIGDRGVLVLRDSAGRLRGIDWRTGKPRWDTAAPAGAGTLLLAGRRVFAVGRREIRGLDVADGTGVRSLRLPAPSGLRLDTGALAEPLCLGGVLYLSTRSGYVGSVAAPD